MTQRVPRLYKLLRGTILHPQWLADRYHSKKMRLMKDVRNSVVLDIGSGKGAFAKELATHNQVFSLDYPATAIRYEATCDVYGDVRRLPFRNASVDVAIFFEVLEHVTEPAIAMAEISRILKPGGKLIASVPFVYPIHDAPYDYWRFTRYGIMEMLGQFSLEMKQVKSHGNAFVTVLQMLNMVILEVAWNLWKIQPAYLILLGLPLYSVCLLSNLLGGLFALLPIPSNLCLGYSFVAIRVDDPPSNSI